MERRNDLLKAFFWKLHNVNARIKMHGNSQRQAYKINVYMLGFLYRVFLRHRQSTEVSRWTHKTGHPSDSQRDTNRLKVFTIFLQGFFQNHFWPKMCLRKFSFPYAWTFCYVIIKKTVIHAQSLEMLKFSNGTKRSSIIFQWLWWRPALLLQAIGYNSSENINESIFRYNFKRLYPACFY